jgi:tetratricopeptide (TPR) repeat protein
MLDQVLALAARRWRTRPARVRVADAELARLLEPRLAPQEVPVEVAELLDLPEIVESLVAGMVPPDPRPGPLTGDGVTVERLRSFARAAADFYDSSCWRHLSNEDLVQVEAPEIPSIEEASRYFIIHRQASLPAGLWFLPDRQDFEALMSGAIERFVAGRKGYWTIGFDRPWSAPPEDVDLWERHGLPWAGEDRCPVAGFTGQEGVERPDARQLAFFEGVLAALAATAETDLDAGRWEKQVETAEGPVSFILSLPELLEPAEAGESEPETPQEQAEDLLDQAYEARGRRVVLLARQALEVWPDCADAYILLASQAFDPQTALDLYEQAMAVGQRAVAPEVFEEQAGHFWGLLETRPYMRARQGLADSLADLGRLEEAAEHFREMLRLNPNDNQGVRHSLVSLLIALDRDEEAQALLDRYGEDDSATMTFPGALLRFRREGDSVAARKSLKRALRSNRFVHGLLLRTRKPNPLLGTYSPGGEDEAALCFVLSLGTWTKTPGALDWLREHTSGAVQAKRKKKRRR